MSKSARISPCDLDPSTYVKVFGQQKNCQGGKGDRGRTTGGTCHMAKLYSPPIRKSTRKVRSEEDL